MSKLEKWFKNIRDELSTIDFVTWVASGIVFSIGDYIQQYPAFYPQFFRWHLKDLADVPVGASIFNMAAIVATGRSRPIASASLVFAMGVWNEINESHFLNRSFDYIDTGCYLLGAVAYVAFRKWASKQQPKLDGS